MKIYRHAYIQSCLLILIVLPVFVAANPCEKTSLYVDSYYRSIQLSDFLPQGKVNDLQTAYLIQKCIVNRSDHKVIGFKAGITDKYSQQRFSTDQSILGVLQANHIDTPKVIELGENEFYLFEAELVAKIKRDINSIESIKLDIKELVDGVAPAIEVANLNFKNLTTINIKDIVAANVGAKYVYFENFKPISEVDLTEIVASIKHTNRDQTKHYVYTKTDYINNIKWLLKQAYLEGYEIREGQILLAGSISSPQKLLRGNYQVDYKTIGRIDLSVR